MPMSYGRRYFFGNQDVLMDSHKTNLCPLKSEEMDSSNRVKNKKKKKQDKSEVNDPQRQKVVKKYLFDVSLRIPWENY